MHDDPYDLPAAAQRIGPYVRRTAVMRCRTFDRMAGAHLYLKTENLQTGGSFKVRGATNAVMMLADAEVRHGVVTHSSGNHAQAVALAAAARGVAALVVMPEGSNAAKVAAVRGYGAKITWCDNNDKARSSAANKIRREHGAALIHPFNDARVIEGQGTAALELLEEVDDLDAVIAPVGGGGLLAGACLAAAGHRRTVEVIGAEPRLADDAYESMRTGILQPQRPPATIADGLRTGLGELPFSILHTGVRQIVLVDDAQILEAMRLCWQRAKLVVEPSGAVALAAALWADLDMKSKHVGIILSGGNVDLCRNELCHFWR